MRRSLGSSWQRKIGLERDLLASLDHPFLVNLKYAFQPPSNTARCQQGWG